MYLTSLLKDFSALLKYADGFIVLEKQPFGHWVYYTIHPGFYSKARLL